MVEVVPMVMAVMISERSKKARTTETCRVIHKKRDLHQVSLSSMYIYRLQMFSNVIVERVFDQNTFVISVSTI